MKKYLNAIGLENLISDEEKIKKYIKKNSSIILDGYNYKYINAYQDKEKEAGVQFVLNKNINTGNEYITINHTNSCVWNFRIVSSIENIDEEDFYFVDNNLEGDYKQKNTSAVIKLINKDILPSVLPEDKLKVQVSGFVNEISFFTSEDEPNQHFNYFKIKDDEEKAYITSLINTKSTTTDNIVLAKHVAIAGIVKEMYVYDFEMFGTKSEYFGAKLSTNFGDIMLYFTWDNVMYCKKGSFKQGSVIECVANLVGDVYLKREMLKFEYNKENILKLFRRAFTEENFSYFKDIIDENCKYKSLNFNIIGRDKIIDKLDSLAKEKKVGVSMRKVIIAKAPENAEIKVGEECYFYSQKNSNGHCLVYVKFNKFNKIKYIGLIKPDNYSFLFNYPKKHIENLIKKEQQNNSNKLNYNELKKYIIEKFYNEKNYEERERRNPTNIITATKYFIDSLGKEYISINQMIDNKINANIKEVVEKDINYILNKTNQLKDEFCSFHDKIIIMNYGKEKELRDKLININIDFIELIETNLEYYKNLKLDETNKKIINKKQQDEKRAIMGLEELMSLISQH